MRDRAQEKKRCREPERPTAQRRARGLRKGPHPLWGPIEHHHQASGLIVRFDPALRTGFRVLRAASKPKILKRRPVLNRTQQYRICHARPQCRVPGHLAVYWPTGLMYFLHHQIQQVDSRHHHDVSHV